MSPFEAVFFWCCLGVYALATAGYVYAIVFKNTRVLGRLVWLVVVGFVLHNLVMMPRLLLATRRGAFARNVLDEEVDYAQRLLATKDVDTVVEVLTSRTGLGEEEVRSFLGSIPRRPPE